MEVWTLNALNQATFSTMNKDDSTHGSACDGRQRGAPQLLIAFIFLFCSFLPFSLLPLSDSCLLGSKVSSVNATSCH